MTCVCAVQKGCLAATVYAKLWHKPPRIRSYADMIWYFRQTIGLNYVNFNRLGSCEKPEGAFHQSDFEKCETVGIGRRIWHWFFRGDGHQACALTANPYGRSIMNRSEIRTKDFTGAQDPWKSWIIPPCFFLQFIAYMFLVSSRMIYCVWCWPHLSCHRMQGLPKPEAQSSEPTSIVKIDGFHTCYLYVI
jgi:hypothetical protein